MGIGSPLSKSIEYSDGAEMSGEKILVVDDRRENLLFLANSVLRPEGYEVITAMDGKQALDKALAERPDLIITDLKMPRMSGLEVMAALRKAEADIPVILTTFYGSEQAAIQAFRLGAKDYIIKPYEVKEMLESVERALLERRLRRETQDLQEGVAVGHHLEKRVRQLHSLCGIGRALNALHEPDEVMRVGVEAAIYLTEADCGQLFLINPSTKQIELRTVRGPSDSRATCVRRAGADKVVEKVVRTGRALIEEREGGGRPDQRVPRLAVPMRMDEQVVGVLAVDAKAGQQLDENDRYQLGILSSFAAVALANATVIEELKGRAASAPQAAGPAAPGGAGQGSMAALSESIAEAERLSRELRNLAAAAQVLAAKLQVQSGTRSTDS
jgi:two-component system NtrC family sensor kinase